MAKGTWSLQFWSNLEWNFNHYFLELSLFLPSLFQLINTNISRCKYEEEEFPVTWALGSSQSFSKRLDMKHAFWRGLYMLSHKLSEQLKIIFNVIILQIRTTISTFIKYSLCARLWFTITLNKKLKYIELDR